MKMRCDKKNEKVNPKEADSFQIAIPISNNN